MKIYYLEHWQLGTLKTIYTVQANSFSEVVSLLSEKETGVFRKWSRQCKPLSLYLVFRNPPNVLTVKKQGMDNKVCKR